MMLTGLDAEAREVLTFMGWGWWKLIISGLDNFKSLVNFEVKNGSRLLFWYDVWCGDQPPKDQFPGRFRMARFKDATMQQVVSWNRDQNH